MAWRSCASWATPGVLFSSHAARPLLYRALFPPSLLTYLRIVRLDTIPVVGQTQAILATIDDLLAQAGTDKRTILTAHIWLKDMSDFAAMNTVWCAWVDPDNKPVRACVQSTLSDPAFLVEIQVTAAAAAMD